MDKAGRPTELVVVDDASKDGSLVEFVSAGQGRGAGGQRRVQQDLQHGHRRGEMENSDPSSIPALSSNRNFWPFTGATSTIRRCSPSGPTAYSAMARAGRWMAGKRDIGVMAGRAPPRTPLRSRLDWPAFFISGNPPAACSPPRGGIAGDRGKDRGRKSGTGFPPAAKGGKAKRPPFYFLFPEITTVSFPFLVLTSTLPSPGPELPA